MIRVGLVTTWGIRCGVQEYSRMLIDNMPDKEIEFTVVSGPFHFDSLYPRVMAGNFDVIHFNYDSGFLGIFSPGVATRFKANHTKIVITLNDHHAQNNREIFPFTSEFDAVVVHQETPDGFTFIPIGIEFPKDGMSWNDFNTTIGTAGFPLPQKGILDVAHAAAILVQECPEITGLTMVCPESQHIDTHQMGRQVKAIFPAANYITAWLPQTEVSKILAGNLINVFPMKDGKSGISSSVRMGIATGSYMVMSRSLMFADLYGDPRYKDEIEWIPGPANEVTPRMVADACKNVLKTKRKPKNILKDFTWENTALRYSQLYHQLTEK